MATILVRDGGNFFLLDELSRAMPEEKKSVLVLAREALDGIECPNHRDGLSGATHLLFRGERLEVDRTCCENHMIRLRARLDATLGGQ